MTKTFNKIRYILLYWFFWILLFEVARFAFIQYNHAYADHSPKQELAKSFLFGLRMDISAASYIIIPICLFAIAALFSKFFTRPTIYKVYTAIALLFVLLIICCDLPSYKAWGFRLDATPLKYLASPKEAWASVSNLPLVWLALGFLLTYFLIYKAFKRHIVKHAGWLSDNYKKGLQLLLLLLFTGLQIIPIRGGTQLAPINQSSVYFSLDNFSNMAAINVPWNFFRSLSNSSSSGNPYTWMQVRESKKIIDSLFKTQDTLQYVIDPQKKQPNIIIIVWESFTAKAVNQFRNGQEITPGFNRLLKEGIYFPETYATGDRTDKGIPGILSGYPAQPLTSILKIPEKSRHLPTLPALFAGKGYHNSFYYGGELEFANMKAYLLNCGFHSLTDVRSFAKMDLNSKWGAHDHVVKNKILKDLDTFKAPFFLTWLTLSSHEPYEIPVEPVIKGERDVDMFLSSIHYTDSIISEFIQVCRSRKEWQNTLVVIIADHGHRLPYTNHRIDDFHIPMLWLGGALKNQGIVFSKTCSQVDIASTLIRQVGIAPSPFIWSKDIFSGALPWAYFSFNDGFGFVNPDGYSIFDNVGKSTIELQGANSLNRIRSGKALEQETVGDYLRK